MVEASDTSTSVGEKEMCFAFLVGHFVTCFDFS